MSDMPGIDLRSIKGPITNTVLEIRRELTRLQPDALKSYLIETATSTSATTQVLRALICQALNAQGAAQRANGGAL